MLPPLQSINDEEAINQNQIIIQNPVVGMLNEPLTAELISAKGNVLLSKLIEPALQIQNLIFNIQNLKAGMCYLRFINKVADNTITKK